MTKAFTRRSFTNGDDTQNCREVLQLLRTKGPSLTVRQLNYCDEACIRRFLKAKGNDLKRAAKQLRATLSWRAEFDVDNITADEFPAELAAGHAFVAGQDEEGQPVVIVRFKPQHITANQAQQLFFRYFVFTMEVAISCMPTSVQHCTLIFDTGCLKKQASGFSTVVQLLKLLGDHYPERVAKAFVVDAPFMFYYLWKGIGGFFSTGLKKKLKFVYSLHYNTKSASHFANGGSFYSKSSEHNIDSEQEASDQFDLSNTSWSSSSLSTSGQSASYSLSSRLSSSFSSSATTSSPPSSGPSLLLGNNQARSFSFATSCTSKEHIPTPTEFWSVRVDTKCTDVDNGYSSARWADLALSSSSRVQGPKTEEVLRSHQIDQDAPHCSKEKGMDAFSFYYHNFFVHPYCESEYRAKMKTPLGGLVAIVSPDVKSPHARFSLDGRAMESMLHYVTFD